MDYGNRRTSDDQLEQASRTVLRWVFGPGFLSLHVGVYLVSVVALLLWNFARTPNDVWVDDPLRTWGLVVVFHITAVAAGTAAWRLMRLGETPPPVRRTVPVTRTGGATQSVGLDSAAATAHFPTGQLATARVEQPVPVSMSHDDAETPAFRPAGSSASEWGTLFVRRAREMMSSARDQMSPSQQARATKLTNELNGVAAPPPKDPLNSWPGATSVPTANTWPTNPSTPNGYPETPARNGQNGHNGSNGYKNGNHVSPVTPDFTPIDAPAPPQTNGAIDPSVNEDARWNWVESAAAAWMSRREREDSDEKPADTPPPALADDATTAP